MINKTGVLIMLMAIVLSCQTKEDENSFLEVRNNCKGGGMNFECSIKSDSLVEYNITERDINISISSDSSVMVNLGNEITLIKKETNFGYSIGTYISIDSLSRTSYKQGLVKKDGIIINSTSSDYDVFRLYKPVGMLSYYDTLGILIKTDFYDDSLFNGLKPIWQE